MSSRICLIGDVHGCLDELIELYRKLAHESIDEVWHLGDLVDRGPDSGGVIDFCMRNGIKGVKGNHEDNILNLYDRHVKSGWLPKAEDKCRTISQLNTSRAEWIRALPNLHILEELNTVLVHGGLWPFLPLHAQPLNVIRAQMINPNEPGRSRWWGRGAAESKHQKTEGESRAEGWSRWYEIYDGPWNVVFGHSVFKKPFVHKNESAGTIYGIDQGSCFGGYLTALILPEGKFVQVRVKQAYVGRVFED